ncbi:MAG: hypothetical protein ACRDBG_26005 [Waterburya sp.]
MATINKNPRTKRTQPKKCTQTVCGNTCIKTGYTCHDNDPNAKKKIRQRGKELVDRIQGKDTPKTKVDRAVEKASAKTRRKPQTENEKTAKVLRREQAQRIIRELQSGETKSKNQKEPKIKPQLFRADIEKGKNIVDKFEIERYSKEYQEYVEKAKRYEADELKKINDFKQKIGKPLVSVEDADIKPLNALHQADLNYRHERSKYLRGELNRLSLATQKLEEEFNKTPLGQSYQKLRDSFVSRTPNDKEIILGKNLEMQRENINSFLSLLRTPLSKPVYIMEIENGQREFSQTDGNVYGIAIKKNSTKDVVYHELAHILEVDRGVTAKSKEWVLSRAESKEPVPLGEGYRPDEKAYKGNFFHPYLGKVYSSDHTEVLSVSVQYLSDNSLSHILYTKDPELFYFAVANLN